MIGTRVPLTTAPLAEQASRYRDLLAEIQRSSKIIADEFEALGWPGLAMESSFIGTDAKLLRDKVERFAKEAAGS